MERPLISLWWPVLSCFAEPTENIVWWRLNVSNKNKREIERDGVAVQHHDRPWLLRFVFDFYQGDGEKSVWTVTANIFFKPHIIFLKAAAQILVRCTSGNPPNHHHVGRRALFPGEVAGTVCGPEEFQFLLRGARTRRTKMEEEGRPGKRRRHEGRGHRLVWNVH